jgi:predicted nucleotidyltransferase
MGGEPFTDPESLGNAEHQRLLRAMTAYIAGQPWTLAFLVFGSVGRGDWHEYSDLDLDVVVTDAARLDAAEEAARMCAAIGERAALIAPRRSDSAEVVFDSLAQFSIRYHPLAATSPNILDSMRLLWGVISLDEIRAAGARNRAAPVRATDYAATLALAVRALLYAQIGLARGRLWGALQSLAEAHDDLLALYAETRDLPRPLPSFERDPDPTLRAALAPLAAASLDPAAIRAALLAACDLLESDTLPRLANGHVALTDSERHILAGICTRLQDAEHSR